MDTLLTEHGFILHCKTGPHKVTSWLLPSRGVDLAKAQATHLIRHNEEIASREKVLPRPKMPMHVQMCTLCAEKIKDQSQSRGGSPKLDLWFRT